MITIADEPTSLGVQEMLPQFEAKQIQKAIYQLMSQDRIFRIGKSQRLGSHGRPLFIYGANPDWEPANKEPDTRDKVGRKTYPESLQTDGGRSMQIIRFRDRKIRLLTRLLDKVSGSDKDLLIGILNDFGHRP